MIDKSLQLADSGSVLGQIESIDMKMLIKNITDTIDTKDVNIEVWELPKIKGNPTKVSVLFENLLNNAITHSKAKTITISNKTSLKYHKILISNDGAPFSDDAKISAFKKRFTTKINGYGGHGLLIVQKIVEAHNWKIKLNDKDKTTIELTIPKKR
jgi:signal transduction histidine kinase